MKKSLLLSFALLTFSSATPVHAQIVIPNSVEAGMYIAGGLATGAFSLLTGALLLKNINLFNKEKTNNHSHDKINQVIDGGVAIIAGLVAIASVSSGYVSYKAFNNACQILK